jgi:hypothetical protein
MAEEAVGSDGTARRPSRPSRVRKAMERAPTDEAPLARMVRELHELEDDITAKLTSADRVLAQLASRRTHEDGGYTSWTEFEERMLATSPALRAMREAIRAPAPTLGATPAATKREALDVRARQTKALTSMARAIERLRGLEAELRQCASHAASKLSTIEGMRVYEECGYASFEEFLERALGPSPVLASAVALVGNEPLGQTGVAYEPPVEPAAPTQPLEEPAFASALFPEGQALLGSALMTAETPVATADKTEPRDTQEANSSVEGDGSVPVRPARARIVVSVLLCCAAIVAGAAAGIGSGIASRHPLAPAASIASASPSPSPSASASASQGMPELGGHAQGQAASGVKPAVPVLKGSAPAGSPVTH